MASMRRPDPQRQTVSSRAVYVISVAAELAGVHPQTLRIYERKGLIEPSRTEGRSRRYSDRDIALLQRIQELTNDGVSLAGVRKILYGASHWPGGPPDVECSATWNEIAASVLAGKRPGQQPR